MTVYAYTVILAVTVYAYTVTPDFDRIWEPSEIEKFPADLNGSKAHFLVQNRYLTVLGIIFRRDSGRQQRNMSYPVGGWFYGS